MPKEGQYGDARPARRTRKPPILAYVIVGAILAMCIAVPVAGWQLIYSPSQRKWVSCTVESAQGGAVGGHAGRPAVFIDTSDCGRLRYRWMVTDDNRDALARQFRVGRSYDFLMAPFDRWTAAHPSNPIFDRSVVWQYR